MTRIPKLTMLGALALCVACAGEYPSAPNAEPAMAPRRDTLLVFAPSNNSARKYVSRPAGGSCTTNIHSTVLQPAGLFLDMTGQCNLKHMGRTTMVIHQECYVDGSCVNWTTQTAANGDLVYSTFFSAPGQNTFDGLHAEFTGTETYVGGTGRFAGASGSSVVSGTADIDPATGGFTGKYQSAGKITF